MAVFCGNGAVGCKATANLISRVVDLNFAFDCEIDFFAVFVNGFVRYDVVVNYVNVLFAACRVGGDGQSEIVTFFVGFAGFDFDVCAVDELFEHI